MLGVRSTGSHQSRITNHFSPRAPSSSPRHTTQTPPESIDRSTRYTFASRMNARFYSSHAKYSCDAD